MCVSRPRLLNKQDFVTVAYLETNLCESLLPWLAPFLERDYAVASTASGTDILANSELFYISNHLIESLHCVSAPVSALNLELALKAQHNPTQASPLPMQSSSPDLPCLVYLARSC